MSRQSNQDAIPSQILEVTDQPFVEARFYITGVALQPVSRTKKDAEGNPIKNDKGYAEQETVMGSSVTMNAAKHGTFGEATPSGSLTMLIQNPGAASIFKEAFEASIKSGGQTPRFRVYFVLDEDQSRS